ncbi:mitochondrial fission ELM1 family protein [Roseibium sediminis]|uniref:mitochondrial fission ELM1 family protein n=1 Tax=Roseibium sediminis TaxID=1775174 RepID=UPI00123D7054|nr:mitochondrial fission ELM1 family protein [Roseibium sediminis]
MKDRKIWLITDGKAGDLAQCEGVARALGGTIESKIVAPRAPFSWFLPHGPVDPRESSRTPDSPLAPPFPDIAIASGRRAVGYLRHLKRASNGSVFTVCLKDPRAGTGIADFIWVQDHDPLRGNNVLVTPTSPHRFSVERLEELRGIPDPRIDTLTAPRVAVLVGGNSRHHQYTTDDFKRFDKGLSSMAENGGASFMITTSRRTPRPLETALQKTAGKGGHFLWDGTGENPLGQFLAKADAVIVTADSTNMIGEAAVSGAPIHVFHPNGGHRKIDRFLATLEKLGILHPFPGQLITDRYTPIDATPVIAAEIEQRYAHHRDR